MSETAHYTVLARRFRPQTFDDVVGQQPVAQALKNAIKAGRVAHAYLFTGARGVGKTSMARILAKALNCPNQTDGEPCQTCDICEGIAAGQDVDVLEIDGASNRGIDDIRSLRANVTVKSMRTRFKLYIIDEVHMLTKEAFNALLKTLEEPPPNVKFVFCTTEPNKVPDTILSRCQRFDFATIETQNIMIRLQQIAEAEGYTVDADALELVARRARGSMRDSQSLFDQLLAFGSEHITSSDVHRLFGTASDSRLTSLIESLFTGDREAALNDFASSLAEGVQLSELVDQLLNCFRDLMVLASGASSVPLLGVADSSREVMQKLSSLRDLNTIVAALEILAETKTRMMRASFGRALAEVALVRISLLENLGQIDQMIQALRDGKFPPIATVNQSSNERSSRASKAASAAVPPPIGAGSSDPVPAEVSTGSNTDSVGAARSVPDSGPESKKKEVKGVDKVEEVVETTPPKDQFIEITPGAEDAILSQVVDIAAGALSSHLRRTTLAISGPKTLAFSFPASYSFGKSQCERSETRSEIRSILDRVVGPGVEFQFELLPEEDSPVVQEAAPTPKGKVITVSEDDIDDDFVRSAIEVFGASPVKREEHRT